MSGTADGANVPTQADQGLPLMCTTGKSQHLRRCGSRMCMHLGIAQAWMHPVGKLPRLRGAVTRRARAWLTPE